MNFNTGIKPCASWKRCSSHCVNKMLMHFWIKQKINRKKNECPHAFLLKKWFVSVCNASIFLHAHANAPVSALVKSSQWTREAYGPTQYHFHQGILCYYRWPNSNSLPSKTPPAHHCLYQPSYSFSITPVPLSCLFPVKEFQWRCGV